MLDWLQAELTRVAFCWRLDRRDGISLGFTGHDRDLVVDGLTYAAAPGMVPSAVTREAGFAVATLDVAGALTHDRISAADLDAGRWDGAAVRMFATDWGDPDAVPLLLARGEIGDVATRGGGFEAELRGPTAVLERPVVERTSPECRAALGDRRCRVDMAGRVMTTAIVQVADVQTMAVPDDGAAPGRWGGGRIRWLDGAASGLSVGITASEGGTLFLRDAPPFGAVAGDRVELTEGCDRSLATCSDRFGNAANFRGEPHLPGNDLLTRYPGE
ncbi:DUF2163 domain-containing protein [Sphingomonas montana]|uniref:DUF2163 domain-containing protein n=1 Tax=Sphingomonas montana TaxID=1843236 RepID=UPI00096C9D78|nr:DUF2163 domain-containing protein [Sphingomonas montana]